MNKKGNVVTEPFIIMFIIIIFGLVSIFGSMVFDDLNADFQADNSSSAVAKENLSNLHGKYTSLFDNLFLMMFCLVVIFVLVSAYFIDTHPIMFAVSLVMMIGILMVSPMIANVYDDVVTTDGVSTYAEEFAFTGWIMRHLVEMIVAISFMVLTVIYLKFKT